VNLHFRKLVLSLSIVTALSACSGDDGDDGVDGAAGAAGANGTDGTNGADGTNGSDGVNGLNSLITQTVIAAGNTECFDGGLRVDSGIDDNADGALAESEIDDSSYVCNAPSVNDELNFNRVASFAVCTQLDANCDTDTETASEIVAVSSDYMTLIYSDSPQEAIGFVDITNPEAPVADGTLDLSGEPTSVAVKGDYALVGVNTSADFVNVSGHLEVVNIETQTSVRMIDLGGQPDSVAVSPDGTYAVVAIENERDEDLGDGELPQMPAGDVVVLSIADADPANWTASSIDVTGTSAFEAGDPEPEYVDINSDNVAVVTLQENNHLILIDLPTMTIINEFSAGEEDPALIMQVESEAAVVREPDGVSWINTEYFATADEGDMLGGSRGFTVFNTDGEVVFNSAETMDHLTARLGHYPDGRSGNKGNEPENIEFGVFGSDRYLFVNSERSSLVFVYDVADPTRPMLKQILPAGAGPEGGLAIPSRNLLVVASEEDNRGDKIRSVLNIYSYEFDDAQYPTVTSANREDGTPIPWSAMSGLSADSSEENVLWAVEDSFYASNRIFKMDVSESPAVLSEEIVIMDSDNVFSGIATSGATEDPDSFDAVDLANLINADGSVNIDPEGIAKASDGGFWVASEGSGTASDTGSRPINSLNFIFKTDAMGVIEDVITLPDAVNDLQVRFGFEGVAEYDGSVYVTVQRAWEGEANPRIGIYDVVGGTWEFVFYPLNAAESQDGGWVGLSDITSLGGGEFLVIERDNKGGPDAAIKRLYTINLSSYTDGDTITKTLVTDLIPTLQAAGGLTYEKIEGSAVMANGDVYIINDNDGVDDNSGETQLINLGNILD